MEGWILASGDADEDERVQTTTDGEWLVLTIEPVPAPRCTVVVVDTPDQPRSPAIELSADPEEAEINAVIQSKRIFGSLKQSVEHWKGHDPDTFGELQRWGELCFSRYLRVGSHKVPVVRQTPFFLFERILLVCKRRVDGRTLALKGRIYMANIIRIVSGPGNGGRGRGEENEKEEKKEEEEEEEEEEPCGECVRKVITPGRYCLHVHWKNSEGGVEEFAIGFDDRQVLADWKDTIQGLLHRVHGST